LFAVKPERRQQVRKSLNQLRKEDFLANDHIKMHIKLIMAILCDGYLFQLLWIRGLLSYLERGLNLINHSNVKIDQQQDNGDVDKLSYNNFPHYLRELAGQVNMLLIENQTLNPVDDHVIENHDEYGRQVRPDGFKHINHRLVGAWSVAFDCVHKLIGIQSKRQPILIS
jgi:hypothetical protein